MSVDKSNIKEQPEESRVALVIGNSKYINRPLHNPCNDAQSMASKLEVCGFDVQLETDLDLSEFNKAVRLFGKRLREKKTGVGLVFYSGHGIQIGDKNYLIPLDFDAVEEADATGQAVQADRLLQHMKSGGCNLNIIILDACRDNPLFASSRSLSKGLATMSASGDSLIIYATQPNGIAIDGDKGGNSIFTSAFLDVLTTPNMAVEQALKIVTKTVQEKTNGKQRPWVNQSLTRDFYFNLDTNHKPAINNFIVERSDKNKLTKLKISKITASLVVIVIVLFVLFIKENNEPNDSGSRSKESVFGDRLSDSSQRKNNITKEHVYLASKLDQSTFGDLCKPGDYSGRLCGVVKSFGMWASGGESITFRFNGKKKDLFESSGIKEFMLEGQKYSSNINIGTKIEVDYDGFGKIISITYKMKQRIIKGAQKYIDYITSSSSNIKKEKDAIIYYAASESDEYITSPPFESPSGNEYFSWTCNLKTKKDGYYVCWSTGKRIISWVKNIFSNSEGSQGSSIWTGNVFVFKDIRKKFTDIQQNTSYKVVGKYSENLSVNLDPTTQKNIPVLVDVFVFKHDFLNKNK